MPRELGADAPTVLGQILAGTDFPADKGELIAEARRRHAPADVLAVLERLPQHTYSGLADVRRAVGKAVESLHTPQATSSRKIGRALDED